MWVYAPEYRRSRLYCEDHVSRACSCQIVGFGGDWPNAHPEAEPLRDKQGRLLPCVEYDFEKDGWNELDIPDDD